jgi:hypothetical protein
MVALPGTGKIVENCHGKPLSVCIQDSNFEALKITRAVPLPALRRSKGRMPPPIPTR